NPPSSVAAARRSPAPQGSAESARRLFAASCSIGGTLAERYLHERRLTNVAGLASLRFHPRCFYRPEGSAENLSFPALIACVTDLSGAITGVHRTWLDSAGGKAPVETPRRAMGNLLGNAVRFGTAEDVLAAGEGIETVLSVREVLPALPLVAALSSNHLAAILFPARLRVLYILHDADPAGDAAVAALTDRAAGAGIVPHVLSPQFGDFNDDLRRAGFPALRATLVSQLRPVDVERFVEPALPAG
ncbi:MAG: toprim domain-containing protein, partial [Pirellulales bacterium]